MRFPTGVAGMAAAGLCLVSLGLGDAARSEAGGTTHIVEMTSSLDFSPAELTIEAGDTVEWRNPSLMSHTVTADPALARDPSNVKLPEGAETFDSGSVPPGETYSRTFTVAGEYVYFCIPHEEQGMVASLTVRPVS